MGTLSKLKLGRKSDRNFFDLSHDVNTTSDFGFCQPSLIQNIVADSKINLKTKSFVRLAPLPVPTFGRINVKEHTAFVPYRDVFLAYDAFQSHKTVQSGVRHYVPKKADNITNERLFAFLMNISYIASQITTDFSQVKNSLFFRMALYTRTNTHPNTDHVLFNERKDYYDPLNSREDLENFNQYQRSNAYAYYVRMLRDSDGPFKQAFYDIFGHNYNFLNSAYSTYNTGEFGWNIFTDLALQREFKSQLVIENTTLGRTNNLVMEGLPDYDVPFFSEHITLDNADFVLALPAPSEQVGFLDNSGNLQYGYLSDSYCCIKLTQLGRRLFKILTADGVNFGYRNKPVDVLSLYSYYKVWFDKYNPGRNYQWYDTNCYYLIHGFYDFGVTLNEIYDNESISVDSFAFNTKQYRKKFSLFLQDLAKCCYTLPIDNITVATQDILEQSNNNDLNKLVINYAGNTPDLPDSASTSGGAYGSFNDDIQMAGGLGIKLLNRIYHLVNKNSVIGARIDEYLKAHNIGSPLPESLVLSDHDYSVYVEDQFSTAETSEGYLGEFAGKAKQFDDGDFMKFETPNAGVLIQLFTIVPFGGYVQAGRPGMVDRYDFYNSVYDSLGKEPLTQYEVNSRFYLLNNITDDSVFGFVPQYFNKKVRNNLANGGFALRSQNAQFLPYSLDRIFSVPDLIVRRYSSSGRQYIEETPGVNLVADEYLRYIGQTEGFGNYNRIFYDTTGLTDNFIVSIVQELKVFSPMKPVSESFDTYDPEMDNGITEVSHS